MAKKDKPKTLDQLIKENKIEVIGEVPDVPKISTGIVELDKQLDGGLPRGKHAEFFGAEGGGKSAIALSVAAVAQKKGRVVWVDLEDAFNPVIATLAGLNVDELLYVPPDSAEATLQLVEDVIVTGEAELVVIDSVAGMVPRAEIEGDFGDAHVGLTARLMSQALRKFVIDLKDSDTTVIWINQIRDKIGVVGYGEKSTTTGGRGLKFWCSTRLKVARTGYIKKGESDIIGHKVQVYVQKARFSRPFQKADFDIYYQTGISNGAAVLKTAIEAGLLSLNGSWVVDVETGESLCQGFNNFAQHLDANPVELQELLDRVTETV